MVVAIYYNQQYYKSNSERSKRNKNKTQGGQITGAKEDKYVGSMFYEITSKIVQQIPPKFYILSSEKLMEKFLVYTKSQTID